MANEELERQKAAVVERRKRMGHVETKPVVVLPEPPKADNVVSFSCPKPTRVQVVTAIIHGFIGYHRLSEEEHGRVDPWHILREVSAQTGVPIDDMRGPRRMGHIIDARHIAMWRMHKECRHMTFTSIGKLMGGKDHTTVIAACRRMERLSERAKEAA